MKIAVPDLISNSYFPAVAAVELGFFRQAGLDMTLEHIFPVDAAFKAMRDGEIDFVAGSAHGTLATFPGWRGAKLLAALSQGMYWLLVLRSDLGAARGEIDAVKGLHIGAAPVVEQGLRRLLVEAGIDIEADGVRITPVSGTIEPGISFGVAAAKALEDGRLDGFWANAMGAETAILVLEKFGVRPASIPDWLALVGDSADGIPGIPRWGARSASTVLHEYGLIEAIPDDPSEWTVKVRGAATLAKNLRDRRADAALYRTLATLRTDVPLDECLDDLEWRGAHRAAVDSMSKELGSPGLADRVSRWSDS